MNFSQLKIYMLSKSLQPRRSQINLFPQKQRSTIVTPHCNRHYITMETQDNGCACLEVDPLIHLCVDYGST